MSEKLIEPQGSAFYRIKIDGLRGELRDQVEKQIRFFIQSGLPEGYIDLRIYFDERTLEGDGVIREIV